MQVVELLEPLDRRRVEALARELALSTTGLGKREVSAKIARALGESVEAPSAVPPAPAQAVNVLLGAFTLEDCLGVLQAYDTGDTAPSPTLDVASARARVTALSQLPPERRRRREKIGAAAGDARRGEGVFRHMFVPALLAAWTLPWLLHWPAGQLQKAAAHGPFDVMSAVLLASMALIWGAEQLYPANPSWNYNLLSGGPHGWRQLGRDLLYVFGIAQLSALLVKLAAPRVQAALGLLWARPPHPHWPAAWPFALRVLLAFFAVELFSYWLHRAAHHVPLLWRFHATHHVITELTGLKALRTHPVDNVLFYVVRSIPLLLLGAGVGEVLAVTYLGSTLSLLAHANVRVSEGGLGWFINLPHFHSVHHSADEVESKSNFGCHTIVWDRLFGTFRRPSSKALEIGVRPVGPRSLWQELVAPFYRA